MRRVLTNPIREVLEPLVEAAKKSPAGDKPDLPDREFLEAVLYRARTGLPWRRPARGVRRLERRLPAGQAVAARRQLGPPVRRPPGRRPGRRGQATVRRFDGRPGPPARRRGEQKKPADDEALGRSRGGFSTKIHVICTDEDTAVGVVLTPGQAGDAPQFGKLFDAGTAEVPTADEVVADKGYDSWDIKNKVLEADAAAHIPSKSNAAEPWPHDPEAYADRNRVERLFNKLKQFRAVATRFDKLGKVFLATVKIALTFIKVRAVSKARKTVNRT